MIFPLLSTPSQSFFSNSGSFVGVRNYIALILDPRLSRSFWNAFRNNVWFFAIHMALQIPIGLLLAALLSSPGLRLRGFYRTVFFIPAILSFVIVGFVWRLLLSPTGASLRACSGPSVSAACSSPGSARNNML